MSKLNLKYILSEFGLFSYLFKIVLSVYSNLYQSIVMASSFLRSLRINEVEELRRHPQHIYMASLVDIKLQLFFPFHVVLIVFHQPRVEVKSLFLSVCNCIDIANQIVQNIMEKHWQTFSGEELFAHYVEVFEVETIFTKHEVFFFEEVQNSA